MLPGWPRAKPREPGEDADEVERQLFQKKYRAFLDANEKLATKGEVEMQRVANMHYVKALDHTLWQAVKVTLRAFAPSSFPTALRRTEARFFVPDRTIQAQKGVTEFEADTWRLCVKDDTRGQKRWLEMPSSASGARPQLHLCLGEGSVGFPCVQWLYFQPLIRGGTFHADPCHRVMNNLTNALKMSGVWIVLSEVMVAMDLPCRPWNSDAEWQRLVGAAEKFHRYSGPDSELFKCLYVDILEDEATGQGDTTKRREAANLGTGSHMREVWSDLQSAPFLRRRGKR